MGKLLGRSTILIVLLFLFVPFAFAGHQDTLTFQSDVTEVSAGDTVTVEVYMDVIEDYNAFAMDVKSESDYIEDYTFDLDLSLEGSGNEFPLVTADPWDATDETGINLEALWAAAGSSENSADHSILIGTFELEIDATAPNSGTITLTFDNKAYYKYGSSRTVQQLTKGSDLQFTLTPPNVAPTLDDLRIDPTSPTTTDDLDVYATCSDTDTGDTLTAEYKIYKNGVEETSRAGTASVTDGTETLIYTVQSSDTADEPWKAEVRCYDATEYSGYSDVSVAMGNSAPVLTPIGSKSVAETSTLSFTVTATDPDVGDTLILSASGVPSGATFTSSTGAFSWTTTYQDAGEYTVTFTVTDDSGVTDSEDVTITVGGTNRAPTIDQIGATTDVVQSTFSVDEGSSLTFTVSASDPDGDTPSLTASNLPSGATFTDNGDGTGDFSWDTDFDDTGTYTTTFTAEDGDGAVDTEAVSISVGNVNRAPTFTQIDDDGTDVESSFSIDENSQLLVDIEASDLDADTLTITITGNPSTSTFSDNGDGTATFSWTPTYEEAGSYQVTFTVSDGTDVDSEVIDITVGGTNRAPSIDSFNPATPVSIDEGDSVEFSVTTSDADGDTLTYTWTVDDSEQTETSASYTFATDYTTAGTHTIEVEVSDGGLSATQTWTVAVGDVNLPPAITLSQSSEDINEGDTVTISDYVTVTDPESLVQPYLFTDTGEYTVTSSDFTEVLSLAFNNLAGKKIVDPLFEFTASITYAASCGEIRLAYNSQTIVDINVGPSTANCDVTASGSEEIHQITISPVTIASPSSFAISASVPSNSITIKDMSLSSEGVTTSYSGPDGINVQTGEWTPNHEQSGSYNVVVTSTDPDGASDTALFTINVGNTNRAPVANIESPTENSVQYINNLVLLDTEGSGDPDDDANEDGEVSAVEDQATYVWDLGKRKEPWGTMQIPAGQTSPACVGEAASCTTGFLMLGDTIPQQGGNPCVCLQYSSLHTADDGYPAGGTLSDEHYIYQTNSVDVVDASDFDLRSQIDRYVQYTSLDACDGWDGPGYSEPASCGVTLTVIDDDGAAAQDTVTFSLSQTDNSDPVVIYSPDKTEASEGDSISFDATSTYDVDGDDLGFTWDFGDGDSATGNFVTHSYVDAGSYTASLSVTDGKTTVTPDSVDITISAGVRPSAAISSPSDGSTLNLGEQVTLSGTGAAPAGATITELAWDLGIRTTPWGEIELNNGLFVCKSSNGGRSCIFGEFETIDGSSDIGTHCSCDDTYPYKEFNIYPSSVVSLSSEQPMLVSYSSFSQCSDYQQTDIICDISLITKDNAGRYSSKDTVQLTLAGLPGDLNADAALSQEDSNIIYNYIVGQVQEVQGNPDCDGDGVATINDFVLIEDVLTGEIESCPGGESGG